LYLDGNGKLRVVGATSSAGLARCRYEMPLYSHRNTGQKKIDDDFVDSFRGLMATFGVSADNLTQSEVAERNLRPEIQLPAIIAETNPLLQQAKIQTRDLYLKRAEAASKQTTNRFAAPSRIRFRR
jgi:hypothetical protein